MEPGNQPIPNRLKIRRKQLLLGQLQIARLLGLNSARPVSQWEQGKAMPSVGNLIKLSLIYHTLPHELYPELFDHLREEIKEKELNLFKMG